MPSLAAKDRFIGTVSHELRTPLSAIVGFAQVLRTEGADLDESDRREYAALILNQRNEVTAIVEDLLVAARAEIGELSTVDKSIDLAAQARQVLEAMPPPINKLEPIGSRLVARGDPGRVRQIIRNLLTNAHRYGGPNIRIELEPIGETAVVRVTDKATRSRWTIESGSSSPT